MRAWPGATGPVRAALVGLWTSGALNRTRAHSTASHARCAPPSARGRGAQGYLARTGGLALCGGREWKLHGCIYLSRTSDAKTKALHQPGPPQAAAPAPPRQPRPTCPHGRRGAGRRGAGGRAAPPRPRTRAHAPIAQARPRARAHRSARRGRGPSAAAPRLLVLGLRHDGEVVCALHVLVLGQLGGCGRGRRLRAGGSRRGQPRARARAERSTPKQVKAA